MGGDNGFGVAQIPDDDVVGGGKPLFCFHSGVVAQIAKNFDSIFRKSFFLFAGMAELPIG